MVGQGCPLHTGTDAGDTLEYNPNLLDDPQWPCGKHKRVLIFASYMVRGAPAQAQSTRLWVFGGRLRASRQGRATGPPTPGHQHLGAAGGVEQARGCADHTALAAWVTTLHPRLWDPLS